MRISKIILDNFRGYKHEEIDFNRFNCIVGKNDVGKSTIFEAIKWFLDSSQNNADSNFNINQLQHEYDEPMDYYDDNGNIVDSYNGGYTPEIIGGEAMSVEICFCDVNKKNKNLNEIFIDTKNDNYSFREQIFDLSDYLNDANLLCIKKSIQHSYTQYFLDEGIIPSPNYSILTKQFQNKMPISLWDIKTLLKEYASIYGEDDDIIQSFIIDSKKRWTTIYTSRYIPTIIESIRIHLFRFYKYNLKWTPFDRTKTDYLAIIPKFRYFNSDSLDSEYNSVVQDYINSFLQRQNSFEDIQKSISKEFEPVSTVLNRTIKNNNLSLMPKVTCKFNVQFEFSNGLDSISLKSRGEGIQRVLMNILFRYISNKETGDESIFVFEEPESHLHPEAQKTFFDTLIALSTKYNQVIITTHSPLMVSMCDVKDVIHIKKENEYPKVHQNDNTSLQEVIQDLGIGPNDTMLSLFDDYKSILFVEGKNDIYTLNKISELYKKNENSPIEQSFNEMKCLIIPVGGCSTVEEWANFGIVTQLAKPFAVLLDSDKNEETHESKNQTKLDSVFASLDTSSDESNKRKMKLSKQNFILTRKREMENYIKPCVIENFFNSKCKSRLPEWKEKNIQDICNMMGNGNNVDFSVVAFIYNNEYDRIVTPLIENTIKNLPPNEKGAMATKIREENALDKGKLAQRIDAYLNDYNKSDSKKFEFDEWVYCKEKGIKIDNYNQYESCIGNRSFIYCKEHNIDLDEYKELYNKCPWVRGEKDYLITYIKNKEKINVDISQFDSKEKFENALDEKSKKKIAQRDQIKQDIVDATIPSDVTMFSFSDDIISNWNYIDVPLAVYCSRSHKDYDEKYSDNPICKSIKAEINNHFFEEGNINLEDLDFSYGDNQDEFLDIYNKIKALGY